MIRNLKRNRVLGIIVSVCFVFTLAACGTTEDTTDLPGNTPANNGIEPASTGTDTGGSVDTETAAPDTDGELLEIYLVGETAEGIDPWDNENLDVLEPVGKPLLTSERFVGYYSKCGREYCPDPADPGEIIPGENNDGGRLYYDLDGRCAELFNANFEKAGGEEGKQYGVLLMSKGKKIMCALFDTGYELVTPQNAQAGLSANKDYISLWGAYGEFDFSDILAGVLPEDLYFTAEELTEEYDRLAQSGSLSDILAAADTVSLFSGLREEIIFTEAQIGDLAGLMDGAQYGGRIFEMAEDARAQRGCSVMSLNVISGNGDGGHARINLYEDMKTIGVNVYRESRWVHFDEAYYDAPELLGYIDDLSQDGMPKLFELTDITGVKIMKNGETERIIDDAGVLNDIEGYLSDCTRTPLMNLHGSEYEIVVTAGGMEYAMRPDDNVKDELIFDGHEYKTPRALLKLLGLD